MDTVPRVNEDRRCGHPRCSTKLTDSGDYFRGVRQPAFEVNVEPQRFELVDIITNPDDFLALGVFVKALFEAG